VRHKRSFIFGMAIFAIVMAVSLFYMYENKKIPIDELDVQFAYPISSLDPSIYDDWESGFIGNHIYYRLLPEENKPWIPYLTENVSISCAKPSSPVLNDTCKLVKISFTPKKFNDCMKRVYTIDDIRNEFEAILNAKGWVVPGWKRCNAGEDSICVTGSYVPDQYRRMRAVYFRFGWLKANKNDEVFGSGVYCLRGRYDEKSNIGQGELYPLLNTELLPLVKFHTSQSKNDQFHFAIYGTNELLTDARKNIQVHTPLAYYVISNPLLDKYYLPWNTRESKKIIHDMLTEKDVFFSETPQFVKFAPEGKADKIFHNKQFKGQLEFAIPNYLPACTKLANALNKEWRGISNARAMCTDIVEYITKKVVSDKKGWDGFFVGISASDPSRDSLRYQYFSTNSPDSWTYKYPEPDKLFYQVGIGQSLATVDGKKICNIRPNPLGLSDLFVTDLLSCEG